MCRFAKILAAIGAAVWLGGANGASAEVLWSSIATACTPERAAIQGDRYLDSPDSGVIPNVGVFDPIVLICPVSIKSGVSPDILSMTYRDSTGTSASARVVAQFIRVNQTSGARVVIATLNSNSFTQTALNKRLSSRFTHTLSSGFFYYVRVELDRTTNSETIRSVGVALEKAVPASIAVTAATSTLPVGQSKQYTATATYADNSTGPVTGSADWSSTAPGVATVNQNGLATGVSEGTTSIRAKVGNVLGAAQLEVLPAPTVCGDGSVDSPEQCDDGGTDNGDGCSGSCQIQPGYECLGEPSVCVATMCPVSTIQCEDNNVCTVDACQAETCINTNVDAGTPCPGGACDENGTCVPDPVCGDGIVGGSEQCDDGGDDVGDGCSASCQVEDGYECQGTPSTCTIAACSPGGCADLNVCTTDICESGSCSHVNNTAQCNDSTACTVNDSCAGGSCSGVAISCDDGSVCTIDSCNSSIGCVHSAAAQGTPCDDGNECTIEDTCSAGACESSDAPDAMSCNGGSGQCHGGQCVPL